MAEAGWHICYDAAVMRLHRRVPASIPAKVPLPRLIYTATKFTACSMVCVGWYTRLTVRI